jgi:hypothetical protein
MAKICKLNLEYDTLEAFEADLNAGKILPQSVVFISENGSIWHRGHFFANGLPDVIDGGYFNSNNLI